MKKPKKKGITTLFNKASRALQDWYRGYGPYPWCFACGQAMQVMHHHFHWGRSMATRFEEKNLVPLCQKCHLAHHCGNHRTTIAYQNAMRDKYGQDWEDQLLKIEQRWKKKTQPELREWIEENMKRYLTLS